PKLLLCDEPTGALDVATGRVVLDAIAQVNRELGATTALVTHNAAIAGLGDRVLHFRDGRIVERHQNEKRANASELSW
ncbi:MAG TPA: ABC transporter ATP-binding protein, partial [Polyangia bacterium]